MMTLFFSWLGLSLDEDYKAWPWFWIVAFFCSSNNSCNSLLINFFVIYMILNCQFIKGHLGHWELMVCPIVMILQDTWLFILTNRWWMLTDLKRCSRTPLAHFSFFNIHLLRFLFNITPARAKIKVLKRNLPRLIMVWHTLFCFIWMQFS